MVADRIVAVAEQIAADAALQHALAATTDIAGAARLFGGIDSGVEPWESWLHDCQSQRNLAPLWRRDTAPPAGWMPVRLFEQGGEWQVEWIHALFSPLSDPFLEDSTRRMQAHPANLLLRCSTPSSVLAGFAGSDQPDVLIFHISRCGSTLMAQMFGALDGTRVLAEPPVLDAAIQLYLRGLADPWLVQGMAGALGRSPAGPLCRRVIKFDSWHSLALARIADLFPEARTIIVFRDPIEVLVSHRTSPGMQVLKGAVPYDVFGLAGAWEVELDEFAAWAIAGIARAALAHADRPGILLCDYASLPESFAEHILPHCQIAADTVELERLAAIGARHSKQPGVLFASDTRAKQDEAGPELRALAEKYGLQSIHSGLRERTHLRG